jgi:hypothetical protein
MQNRKLSWIYKFTEGDNLKLRHRYKSATAKLRICSNEVKRFYIGRLLLLSIVALRWVIFKIKKCWRTLVLTHLWFDGIITNAFLGKCRFKGIVSRDFGTLFFISLDKFEGRNMAGSGLFFILMTFSCLNFKKLCLCGKDPSK